MHHPTAAKFIVNQKLSIIEEDIGHCEVTTGFIAHGLSEKEISEKEMLANIVEMFGAAVDTVKLEH